MNLEWRDSILRMQVGAVGAQLFLCMLEILSYCPKKLPRPIRPAQLLKYGFIRDLNPYSLLMKKWICTTEITRPCRAAAVCWSSRDSPSATYPVYVCCENLSIILRMIFWARAVKYFEENNCRYVKIHMAQRGLIYKPNLIPHWHSANEKSIQYFAIEINR